MTLQGRAQRELAVLLLMAVPTLPLGRPPGTGPYPEFADSGQSLGNSNSYCVAVGDLDRDGDLDAIVSNVGAPSRIWLNDGMGVFSDSGQEVPSAACVALADLDGDGSLDAFLTGDTGRVLLNNGTGVLESTEQDLGGPGGEGLAVGDIDRDGDADVVVSRWGRPTGLSSEVWRNSGYGRFEWSPPPVSVEISANAALADIDGDEYPDLLIANQADSLHEPVPDELWLNDGRGAFPGPATMIGRACTYEIATGDLNGDGWLDLFVANSSHAGKSDPANRVYLNDGRGGLLDSGQALGEAYSLSVALGDLDADGDLDAFVGDWGPNRVWVNDGAGRFLEAPNSFGDQPSMDVALGDLDGDGDLDAFVANAQWRGEANVNRVWINQTPSRHR